MSKKIGIIGSGIVAKTLGTGFLKHGYEVMLSSRDVTKLEDWKSKNPEGKIGTFQDSAEYGDILVLAVVGRQALNILKSLGKQSLAGKTIIDATNPISEVPPENGVLQFFTGINSSLMEELQAEFKEANFVKAFNSVGSAFMVNPKFELKPTMFICGDNDNSKKEVQQILDIFGWEVEDMGKAEAARSIEPLCMLWCIPGFRENRWSHAFKLMKA